MLPSIRTLMLAALGALAIAMTQISPDTLAQTRRAPGTTYFVSLQGSDTQAGTESAPFKTIQRGVDACHPGDTLNIQGGEYHENVVLHESGSYFGREIRIQGDAGQPVVLIGDRDGQSRAIFDTNAQDHLIISGVHVKDGNGCGFRLYASWQVSLQHCSSENTAFSGIMVDKCHEVTVEDCDVSRACQGHGEESVSVKRSVSVTLHKCSIHDTNHEGIDVKEGSKHVKILNNRIWNVERQGLYADAWDSDTFDIRYEGNEIHNCMVGLVACTESGGHLHDVWFVDNVVYDCRGPGMMVAKWGNQSMHHWIANVYYINNTVVNCGGPGKHGIWGGGMLMENDEATNVVVLNNILSGNPIGQLRITMGLPPKSFVVAGNLLEGPTENIGEHNVLASAGFVDAEHKDFRLTPTSPARGKGVTRRDIAAPSEKPDIGAFQFGK